MDRVLIVDDAVTVRMYHRQILEAAGFEVDEASNGYEGLERALSGDFRLFVIDVNMPKMDGYDLVRSLRQHLETRAAPVIIVSTEAKAHDRDRALLAGANIVLVKPVRAAELSLHARMLTGRQHS